MSAPCLVSWKHLAYSEHLNYPKVFWLQTGLIPTRCEHVGKSSEEEHLWKCADKSGDCWNAVAELREVAWHWSESLQLRTLVSGGKRRTCGTHIQQLVSQSSERQTGAHHLQPAHGRAALPDNMRPVQRNRVQPASVRWPQLSHVLHNTRCSCWCDRWWGVPHPPGVTYEYWPCFQVQHSSDAREGQYDPLLCGDFQTGLEEDEGSFSPPGLLRHLPGIQALWDIYQTGHNNIWPRWRRTQRLNALNYK